MSALQCCLGAVSPARSALAQGCHPCAETCRALPCPLRVQIVCCSGARSTITADLNRVEEQGVANLARAFLDAQVWVGGREAMVVRQLARRP